MWVESWEFRWNFRDIIGFFLEFMLFSTLEGDGAAEGRNVYKTCRPGDRYTGQCHAYQVPPVWTVWAFEAGLPGEQKHRP